MEIQKFPGYATLLGSLEIFLQRRAGLKAVMSEVFRILLATALTAIGSEGEGRRVCLVPVGPCSNAIA